ncbi:MAG: hypothetical protein QOF98_3655, partial [Streptomyces sp.]|nr:hypothetical protein [Streptomyces sp.]
CEAARDDLLDSHDLTGLVAQHMWQGRLEQAAEIFGTVSARMAQQGEVPKWAALVMSLMAFQKCPELSDLALPSWLRPTDPEGSVAVPVPSAGSPAGSFDRDAVEVAEGVLQGCRMDEDTVGIIVSALTTLMYADQGERAVYWCRQLMEDVAARNAPTWSALLSALRSIIHWRRGELHATEKYARNALALLPVQGWGAVVALPLSAAVLATTAFGHTEEAAVLLAVPVPEVIFQTPGGLLYLQARGRHRLATNRAQAALSDFLRCGELMKKWDVDAANFVAWRIEAATAYLRLGRDRDARELLEEQLTMVGRHDQRVRGRALSLLAATADDLPERARLLAESLDHLQASGDWYEQMRAATELGRTYRRLGDESAARAAQSRARLLAELCGVEADATGEDTDAGAHGPTTLYEVNARASGSGAQLPAPRQPREAPHLPQPPHNSQPSAVHRSTVPLSVMATSQTMASHVVVPSQFAPQTARAKELTRAERRVVALAADGHTNRQIASKLFITVSTVEQHLTRAYRKLRVNRRSDLSLHLLPDVAR